MRVGSGRQFRVHGGSGRVRSPTQRVGSGRVQKRVTRGQLWSNSRDLAVSDCEELVGGDVSPRLDQPVGQVGHVDSDARHLRRRRLGGLLEEVAQRVRLRRAGPSRLAEVGQRVYGQRLDAGVQVDEPGGAAPVAAEEALGRRRAHDLDRQVAD